jgi:hypothetical protein
MTVSDEPSLCVIASFGSVVDAVSTVVAAVTWSVPGAGSAHGSKFVGA